MIYTFIDQHCASNYRKMGPFDPYQFLMHISKPCEDHSEVVTEWDECHYDQFQISYIHWRSFQAIGPVKQD